MTLRQFEVFLAVARAGSFRRAAEALHLSQPALSQHVRELEAELDARLFDRLGRAVHLTEAGRILGDHATRLFATLSDARHAIAELQGLQRGTLAIGASTTPGIYVLPGVLGVFRQRYPAIEVTLQLGNSEQIHELVRSGELDLGVIGDSGRRPAEASLAARMEDELVLVVGQAHAWARRRDVDSGELAGQPLLLREPGSATRQVTERALAAAGVAYRPGMVLPHTEAIKQAVLAGLGVAFVSVYAVQGEQATGRLRALRVRGIRIVRHFHLIHHERRRPSTAARAFVELFAAADPARSIRRGVSRARSR
jgi:DNA-binding transcriptional LysR family regulator